MILDKRPKLTFILALLYRDRKREREGECRELSLAIQQASSYGDGGLMDEESPLLPMCSSGPLKNGKCLLRRKRKVLFGVSRLEGSFSEAKYYLVRVVAMTERSAYFNIVERRLNTEMSERSFVLNCLSYEVTSLKVFT